MEKNNLNLFLHILIFLLTNKEKLSQEVKDTVTNEDNFSVQAEYLTKLNISIMWLVLRIQYE